MIRFHVTIARGHDPEPIAMAIGGQVCRCTTKFNGQDDLALIDVPEELGEYATQYLDDDPFVVRYRGERR